MNLGVAWTFLANFSGIQPHSATKCRDLYVSITAEIAGIFLGMLKLGTAMFLFSRGLVVQLCCPLRVEFIFKSVFSRKKLPLAPSS